MMMRYQRVSPDCVPLSNGKKPSIRALPKEDMMTENTTTTTSSTVSSLESKPFRFRSQPTAQDPTLSQFGGLPTSPSPENRPTHSPCRTPSPIRAGSGGDVLLQWGHKKRSRVSRTEIRVLADESSSSAQARQAKVQRRAAHAAAVADKSMPPPPPPPPVPSSSSTSSFSNGRLRKEASGLLPNRNLEDRSAVVNGSPSRSTAVGNGRAASRSIAGKRSPPPEKSERKMPSCSGRSAKDDKANGSSDHRANHVDSTSLQSEQLAGAANHSAAPAAEKVNYEVVEWPRIYVALSRKEKEDDFLAMKGTKLPQRPKKRAKNIDRTLQYCFPGMWLSDLTRNRYEVREKKCVKKQKRRGLKGMESVESDSE
ncbi:serine/threonine-protein kinase CST20 [Rosa sericea]